ncbi:MAG: coenzyme F420-0:L-glutamate ligase, partial [Candidatus Helarchaeota archaeon]
IILIPLKTKIIVKDDDITQIFLNVLTKNNIQLENGDVLVIAETPLAISQGRYIRLDNINPSTKAIDLANDYEMDPRMVQVVIDEADIIYGGVKHVLLCEKYGCLTANAGVDQSNAPLGTVVLLPEISSIHRIRKEIEKRTNKKIGIVLSDSRTQPLKKGVIGAALAVSGMEPISDERGKPDLYGRPLQFTFRSIADDLATAAQLLMGESNEQIPMVLIKGAPVQMTENPKFDMFMPADECLYMNILSKYLNKTKKY